jgi:hypothetical protein
LCATDDAKDSAAGDRAALAPRLIRPVGYGIIVIGRNPYLCQQAVRIFWIMGVLFLKLMRVHKFDYWSALPINDAISMKCYLYKLWLQKEFWQNFNKEIVEMYIPELGLHCNDKCNFVDYQFIELPRPPNETTPKEIELTEDEVSCLQQLANALRVMNQVEPKILDILCKHTTDDLPNALTQPRQCKMLRCVHGSVEYTDIFIDRVDGKRLAYDCTLKLAK